MQPSQRQRKLLIWFWIIKVDKGDWIFNQNISIDFPDVLCLYALILSWKYVRILSFSNFHVFKTCMQNKAILEANLSRPLSNNNIN